MKTALYAWSIGRVVPCCIGCPTALISTSANVVRPGNDDEHGVTIFKIVDSEFNYPPVGGPSAARARCKPSWRSRQITNRAAPAMMAAPMKTNMLVQDSESSDSIAQMALQDRREDGLDRMPTQNESLTFAQTVLVIDANAELLPLWDFARRCDDHGLNTPMGSVTDLDVRTDWLHVPSVPLIADEI